MLVAKPVTIELLNVTIAGHPLAELTIVVPTPAGLSRRERRAFGDGVADATDGILRALQTASA